MTQNAAGSVNATRLWTKDFVNCANVEGSSSLHRNNGRRRNDDTLYVIFNLHVRNFALKCIPFITIHASWGVMEGGSLPSPQTKPCTVFEIHSKSLILQDLNEMRFFGWIFNHMHLFRGAGVYLFRIPSTLRSPFQNWGRLWKSMATWIKGIREEVQHYILLVFQSISVKKRFVTNFGEGLLSYSCWFQRL